MENDILFSIVTVVKDDLIGLKKTRQSLDIQKHHNWIHIIVDGASGTETQKYLESLPKCNTIFISEPDSGIYDAMNKAWKIAVPKSYVLFLNARDVFTDPDSLSNASKALKAHPQSSWGCTTHEEVYPDGKGWVCKLVSPPGIANQLYAFGYRSHQAVVMKAEFISQLGGFDLSYKIASDWDLIVRALLTERPIVWLNPLVCFERGGFSENKILAAHLELKSLRRIYLSHSYTQKFFESIWMALYLRNFGYSNYLSPFINFLFPESRLRKNKKDFPGGKWFGRKMEFHKVWRFFPGGKWLGRKMKFHKVWRFFPGGKWFGMRIRGPVTYRFIKLINSKLLIADYSSSCTQNK